MQCNEGRGREKPAARVPFPVAEWGEFVHNIATLKRLPETIGQALFFLDSSQEIGTVSDRIPMTQEGYNKIQAEVEHLEIVEMPLIAEKIAEARAEGDLKENAEYHAQREAQGLMQAKINQLRNKLALSVIIDPTKVPKDEVAFGATVKLLDLDLDDIEEITLVGQGDEDYDKGRYLITSPLGQGLLGKKVGDEANIPVPKGTLKFKVLEIRYGG